MIRASLLLLALASSVSADTPSSKWDGAYDRAVFSSPRDVNNELYCQAVAPSERDPLVVKGGHAKVKLLLVGPQVGELDEGWKPKPSDPVVMGDLVIPESGVFEQTIVLSPPAVAFSKARYDKREEGSAMKAITSIYVLGKAEPGTLTLSFGSTPAEGPPGDRHLSNSHGCDVELITKRGRTDMHEAMKHSCESSGMQCDRAAQCCSHSCVSGHCSKQ
jgi:hypothetical protein